MADKTKTKQKYIGDVTLSELKAYCTRRTKQEQCSSCKLHVMCAKQFKFNIAALDFSDVDGKITIPIMY